VYSLNNTQVTIKTKQLNADVKQIEQIERNSFERGFGFNRRAMHFFSNSIIILKIKIKLFTVLPVQEQQPQNTSSNNSTTTKKKKDN
jgi:hypothetical protein